MKREIDPDRLYAFLLDAFTGDYEELNAAFPAASNHPESSREIHWPAPANDAAFCTDRKARPGPVDNLPALLAAEARAGRLAEALRKLLTCSLPHDVSGQRIVDEARAALADAPKVLVRGYYDDEHGVIMRASNDIGVPCIVIATED